MQLFDHNGRTVSLGREIGRGGEGAVFEVVGRNDLVAKTYLKPVDLTKAQKLGFMARMSSPALTRLAAWPTAVLADRPGGTVRGIVMPRIANAKEVHVLYSPAQRKIHFQRADWHFLVRAARNCAASFATLHSAGVVVGDVNQGNILVDAQALVRLIDCDSFQLLAQGKVFRCNVGVSHFTPPELQSCQFDQVDRTTNHDSFGLAVVIFHLLFMGRHPFVGKYTGHGEMPTIEQAISAYRFAFSASATRMQLAPPPHSPPLGIVTPEVAALFERSFARGSENANARPSSAEWASALERMESSLTKCGVDPGHLFSKVTNACPWCAMTAAGSPHFFISVTLDRINAAPRFDVGVIWNRIALVPCPEDVFVRAPRQLSAGIVPKPVPAHIGDQHTMIHSIGATAIGGLVLGCVVLLFQIIPLGLTLLIPSLICAIVWSYLYKKSPLGKERAARKVSFRNAENEWRRASHAVASRLRYFSDAFEQSFSTLNSARQDLESIDQQRANEVARRQRNAQESQFIDHMEQHTIADADIPGIGANRAAILAYHGIETARDIPDFEVVLSIPGFGEVLASSLVAWKQQVAYRFQYNAGKGLPIADLQTLNIQFQQRRLQLELTLQNGEATLRRISAAAKEELEHLDRRVATLQVAVDQARADLRAL